MANARDEKHRYGQHYTPEPVARLLAAFAVRHAGDLVLDPSCGAGRLLQEAIRVKGWIGANRPPQDRDSNGSGLLSNETFGIDRSASALDSAAACGARLIASDFFEVEPGGSYDGVALPGEFDAIIGNPPYIRQELMGQSDKDRIYLRLRQEPRIEQVDAQFKLIMPAWSRRSDIYVYFFAHAARFLRQGGRLVFLTSSNWLDVGYGAPLREFLLMNFRVIAVLESSIESFFADASINTTITVLERESKADARAHNLTRFVQIAAPLSEIFSEFGPPDGRDAIAFAHAIQRISASANAPSYRVRVVRQSELAGEGGQGRRPGVPPPAQATNWGRYLRADDVFFKILDRGSKLTELSRVAAVRFGVKTGANDFFYVRPSKTDREILNGPMKTLHQMASLRRGLTTGANEFFYVNAVAGGNSAHDLDETSAVEVEDGSGNRHLIESRFLAPVVFSLKEMSGIHLDYIRTRKMVFNCNEEPDGLLGTHAIEYIRQGEQAGIHKRPTCAGREPWYSVARGWTAAPLILPSKIGTRWLVAINAAGVLEDKKQYGIFPGPGVSTVLLAALLNSTWARCCAEMTCRQLTGAQAIADIDVAVAERILLPDPSGISTDMAQEMEAALEALGRRPIVSVFEEINLEDRRRLDDLVLQAIGFDSTSERGTVMDEMYSAVVNLVRRRLSK